jgi:hypothetical protein
LRQNRTLNTLLFDGQNASWPGWKALRGCFYGNKKLCTVSYPWADVAMWFKYVSTEVQRGYAQAADVKSKIGAAHRMGNMHLKQQRIQEIIVIKKAYKSLERQRVKSVQILNDMFQSIDTNHTTYQTTFNNKMEMKRSNPNAYVAQEKLATSECDMLTKMVALLMTFRKSPKFISPHIAKDDKIWKDVWDCLAKGPYVFVPDQFNLLSSLVEFAGGRNVPAIRKLFTKMSNFIEKTLTLKCKSWSLSHFEFANLLYANFNDKFALIFVDESKLCDLDDDADNAEDIDVQDDNNDSSPNDDNDNNDDNNNEDGGHHKGKFRTKVPHHRNNHHRSDDIDNTNNDDDAFVAMDMYAGAGPRDLPDGGDGNGRSGAGGVPSGSLSRVMMQSKNGADSYVPKYPEHTVSDLVKYTKDMWLSEISNVMRNSVASQITSLEYTSILKYHLITAKLVNAASNNKCCLITQCSVDRLPRLYELSKSWRGDVSCAIYIPTTSTKIQYDCLKEIDMFADRLKKDESIVGNVTLSVMYGKENAPWEWDDTMPGSSFPFYPINALRNLAVGAVSTNVNPPSLLFLLDVDFVPSCNMSAWLNNNIDIVAQQCMLGTAFVIPAFESQLDYSGAINIKYDVIHGVGSGTVTSFHTKHFPQGHGPTNIDKYAYICN